MTTRFDKGKRNIYGEPPIPTGYEKQYGQPQFVIPSCTLEDVDRAMFDLFDKQIKLVVKTKNDSMKKVPVVFASAEKWAQVKQGKHLRDSKGSLILPLVAISREFTQEVSDTTSRGINQQTGEIIIRRRLDSSDREYQRLINRIFLPNQSNVAIKSGDTSGLTTERSIGDLAVDPTIASGGLLKNNRKNNVYETIVIPSPQFYTAKYTVEITSQYFEESNSIFRQILSSMLQQARCWRIESDKGYWFVASLDDGSPSFENNFDDMSSIERTMKSIFNITVPTFLLCGTKENDPVPVKRYVSAATISFDTVSSSPVEYTAQDPESEYEIGSDDPTLPLDTQKNTRDDQRQHGWRLQKTLNGSGPDGDAALAALPRGFKAKFRYTNSRGESVYTGGDLSEVSTITTL